MAFPDDMLRQGAAGFAYDRKQRAKIEQNKIDLLAKPKALDTMAANVAQLLMPSAKAPQYTKAALC